MLIVTESINADREPNKTHNEPSTARLQPDAASGHYTRGWRLGSRYSKEIMSPAILRSELLSGPDQLFDVRA